MFFSFLVNKHKPWIETSYHGIITENNDTVILDPPLVALDKDAPVPFAGRNVHEQQPLSLWTAFCIYWHLKGRNFQCNLKDTCKSCVSTQDLTVGPQILKLSVSYTGFVVKQNRIKRLIQQAPTINIFLMKTQ